MWWIRNDPCGLFSAFFTVILLLYSQYVITTVVLLPWYGAHYHLIFYSVATLLSLVSHTRAQFTNPGVVPRNLRAVAVAADGTEMQPRTCRRCRAVKPYAAHHCSTCARCIIRMDHRQTPSTFISLPNRQCTSHSSLTVLYLLLYPCGGGWLCGA